VIDTAWQRSLAAWLAAHKTYPDEARRRGTEGSVVLRLTADRSGRVTDVVLVRSAGSPTLDEAAEAMVRNATLPPFTAGMALDRVTVTIQIRYALTN
jgi:protein TonB